MIQEGHVARMGDTRNVCKLLIGKHEGKSHPEDTDVDGRIILEWIVGIQGGKVWTGFI
jgi:hypothetical protein